MDKVCLHFDCGNRSFHGYCKTTVCINPMYSNIGTAQYGQGAQKAIITNADRIRSMTDEELAEAITRAFSLGYICAGFERFGDYPMPNGADSEALRRYKTEESTLGWLRQEESE